MSDYTELAASTPSVQDLLDAGLHFGHQTKRWNPGMKRYIFDERNGIYIIDLIKTRTLLEEAMQFLYDTVSRGRGVLFVGTKKQASEILRETAEAHKQFYVTHRWLGGTLTNNQTIRHSVSRMRELDQREAEGDFESLNKKEVSRLRREQMKLHRNLSGLADMEQLPGALMVVDINRESIAVSEARRLNIPVVALVDTNCDPALVDYPIPGNDDAIRAIRLIIKALGSAVQLGANEYAKVAAEEARRKAAEEAEAKIRREAIERENKKAREEAIRKAKELKSKEAETPAPAETPKTASGGTAETAESVKGTPPPQPESAPEPAEEKPAEPAASAPEEKAEDAESAEESSKVS